MFYYLFYELLYDPDRITSVFRVFRYITFRTVYATLTSLAICFILGPWVIRRLRRERIYQVTRDEYLENHAYKKQTPTMGGIIILIAILLSSLFWGRLNNTCLILACISTAWLGLLGLSDDYLKIVKRKPDGLIARYKLAGQILLALFVGFYTYFFPVAKENATILNIPFFATPPIDLGPLYVPFVVLVIVGASNAVNLTDGLDGLAIGAVIAAGASFAVITYTTGHFDFAKYLKITHIAQCGELTIFLGALVGAGIGFLWFNAYPAQVFMGDIGSLALGGALGTVAVLSKHELLLAVIGGLFVIEAGSVILQVIGYKLTQKRIFRMAPLHHHFEKLGWSEPKITVRFWIIATIFALLSLSTLKLR